MFWCVTAVSLFFRTPQPALHRYLAIHVERAKSTVRPSQALAGILGRPWILSRAEAQRERSPKGPRVSLGESLNVCILARISFPQIKLIFINVYGGTHGSDRIGFIFFKNWIFINSIFYRVCNDSLIEGWTSGSHARWSAARSPTRPQFHRRVWDVSSSAE